MNDHTDCGLEAASMVLRKKSRRSKAKTILRLPDLEQSKNAVLHSLAAARSQESYGHAIDEFSYFVNTHRRLTHNPIVSDIAISCLLRHQDQIPYRICNSLVTAADTGIRGYVAASSA